MINESIAPQPDIWAVKQQGGPPVKPSKLRIGLMVRDAKGINLIPLGYAPLQAAAFEGVWLKLAPPPK
jgi:hypothetical protein